MNNNKNLEFKLQNSNGSFRLNSIQVLNLINNNFCFQQMSEDLHRMIYQSLIADKCNETTAAAANLNFGLRSKSFNVAPPPTPPPQLQANLKASTIQIAPKTTPSTQPDPSLMRSTLNLINQQQKTQQQVTLGKNNLNILNLPATFLNSSASRAGGPRLNLESDLALDDK
jgi:hypothetical protein